MSTLKLCLVRLVLYLLLAMSLSAFVSANSCTFVNDNGQANERALLKLKPLIGKRYPVKDPLNIKYSYSVGICTTALPKQEGEEKAAAVQLTASADKKTAKPTQLGSLDKAKIVAGTDWIFLEYGEGSKYGHHCGNEERRALVMITCDESISDQNAEMVLIEENRNLSAGCYYLFELSHKAICPATASTNLSLGSIFIIVLISVIAVYMFFGFLYQRFVLGAKGMEQIPNYGFWQDFGNLQADGCNFACRSGNQRGPRSYKGVGDDQLDDVTETDDHLLPM